MHTKLKLLLLTGLSFTAINAFAQSKKLVKSFKFGAVGYTLLESNKPSKSLNDTTFYLLYRKGNPKVIAKEIKTITENLTGTILLSAHYTINRDNIDFYAVKNNDVYERIYTQNKKGRLTLKSNIVPSIMPPSEPTTLPYQPSDGPTLFDIPAEFPGGMNALRSYVARNLSYPEEAQENEIEGTVYAKFIVTKDGSVTNIEIEKKLGYGCDEEVIRVLKRLPKWRPAKLKGQAVNSLFRFPVKFALD